MDRSLPIRNELCHDEQGASKLLCPGMMADSNPEIDRHDTVLAFPKNREFGTHFFHSCVPKAHFAAVPPQLPFLSELFRLRARSFSHPFLFQGALAYCVAHHALQSL